MSKKKPIVLTRAVEMKLYKKFLEITLAYFMEIGAFAKTDEEDRPIYHLNEQGEKVYSSDIEKLKEAYSGLVRWVEAISDHLITVKQVEEIIESKLNDEVRITVE